MTNRLTGVNENDPTLRTLATGTLRTGANFSCVKTTRQNMLRLGVKAPGATGADTNNNPRGAMVQLAKNFGWQSLAVPGSKLTTIKSPAYGTIQANVIPAAEYAKLARAGKLPAGAVVFQTKHDSWNGGSTGSRGFDMGLLRPDGKGGLKVFNFKDMGGPLVYGGNTKWVVVMVPGSAVK